MLVDTLESKIAEKTQQADSLDTDLIASARSVVDIEVAGVSALHSRFDRNFVKACHQILACKGRVVVTGMGKSGHIGNKISATLASTGTPAFFVHPAEALHGDLGMITPDDVLIAISNSGNTDEILSILPAIKRLKTPIIAMTGNLSSTLAKQADCTLDVGVEEEACPLGLAPTTSTTVSLVMGDALAVALLGAKGFTEKDFARSHPGGRLGKQLLVSVEDIMLTGDAVPTVKNNAYVPDALQVMSKGGLGTTAVLDDNGRLLGIFTDGDLRRCIESGQDLRKARIESVMTTTCVTCRPDDLAVEALNVMEERKISALLVLREDSTLVGALNMHMLLKAGVV